MKKCSTKTAPFWPDCCIVIDRPSLSKKWDVWQQKKCRALTSIFSPPSFLTGWLYILWICERGMYSIFISGWFCCFYFASDVSFENGTQIVGNPNNKMTIYTMFWVWIKHIVGVKDECSILRSTSNLIYKLLIKIHRKLINCKIYKNTVLS